MWFGEFFWKKLRIRTSVANLTVYSDKATVTEIHGALAEGLPENMTYDLIEPSSGHRAANFHAIVQRQRDIFTVIDVTRSPESLENGGDDLLQVVDRLKRILGDSEIQGAVSLLLKDRGLHDVRSSSDGLASSEDTSMGDFTEDLRKYFWGRNTV